MLCKQCVAVHAISLQIQSEIIIPRASLKQIAIATCNRFKVAITTLYTGGFNSYLLHVVLPK